MKKVLALVLVAILSCGMALTALATEPPQLPFAEQGTETLTVMCAENWYTPASFASTLPVYEELEKLTGVHIEWEVVPNDQYANVRNTRVAAAVDLPDIIGWPADLVKMANDGIFLDLTDLIAEHAYYLNLLMEMKPIVRQASVAADGKIYGFPGMGEGILVSYEDMIGGTPKDPGANTNLMTPAIRMDWLNKLGLPAPTTLEEWETTLQALKDGDPLGDGTEIIPLMPTWGWKNLFAFGEGFGLYMVGNQSLWGADESGTVYHKQLAPEFKLTLEYLARLYSKGLIDQEYALSTFDLGQEKITRNVVASVPCEWMNNPPSWTNNLRAAGFADAQFLSIKGVKNQEGKQLTTNRWPVFSGDTAITKDCKNPELAVKWLDFHLASPEGIKLQMWGVEGLSYEEVNGELKYTDFVMKNPDGLGMFEAIRSIGGWGQVSYIQTKDAYGGIYAESPDILSLSGSFAADEVMLPFPNLNLMVTADENEEFTDLMTDADTYMNETILKFIEGKESLDNFDAYVETAMSMGLARAIEIRQEAYNRFVGK